MGALLIAGPLAAGDVPALCERLRALLDGSGGGVVIECDVHTLDADAVTVEALARLQLTARRRGGRIALRRASCELDRLLSFVGLAEVLAGGRGPAARAS